MAKESMKARERKRAKIVAKYEGFEKSEGVGKEYISKYKKNDRG